METWPGWLGKLLGTDRRAPGERRKAWPHGGGGHPPGRSLRVGPGHLSTWAWPKGRVRYSPVQMPAAPQHLPGHGSLWTQWTGLALCPFTSVFLSSAPPSADRCTCCGLAKPGTWPPFFFPAKQQQSASQPGALSHSQGRGELQEAGQCEEA